MNVSSALGALLIGTTLGNFLLFSCYAVAVVVMAFTGSDRILLGVAVLGGALLGTSIRKVTGHTGARLIPGIATRTLNAAALMLSILLGILLLAALPNSEGLPVMGLALATSTAMIALQVFLTRGHDYVVVAAYLMAATLQWLPDNVVSAAGTLTGQATLGALSFVLFLLIRHRVLQGQFTNPTAPQSQTTMTGIQGPNWLGRFKVWDSLGETVLGSLRLSLVTLLGLLTFFYVTGIWVSATDNAFLIVLLFAWPERRLSSTAALANQTWLYRLPPNRRELASKVVRRSLYSSVPLLMVVVLWASAGLWADGEPPGALRSLNSCLVSITAGYVYLLIRAYTYDKFPAPESWFTWVLGGMLCMPFLLSVYGVEHVLWVECGLVVALCVGVLLKRGHLGLVKADFLPPRKAGQNSA